MSDNDYRCRDSYGIDVVSAKWADAKIAALQTENLRLRKAAEEMKERCAKVCEGIMDGETHNNSWWRGFKSAMWQCAAAIRALPIKEEPK